jgi:hypothetical protein
MFGRYIPAVLPIQHRLEAVFGDIPRPKSTVPQHDTMTIGRHTRLITESALKIIGWTWTRQ